MNIFQLCLLPTYFQLLRSPAIDSTSSAINTLFETAKADTLVLLKDAVCAVKSEKEVSVRALEGKNHEYKRRLTAMENQLHDADMNLVALNTANATLQERVRAGERVNALLTDSLNAACFRKQQQKYQALAAPPPSKATAALAPSYHEQNLLNAHRLYKEELKQLRQHNTLLAGQVRALQDHINEQPPPPS